MNFDEIKKAINEDAKTDVEHKSINLHKGENNPISMIRSNMRKEILTQLFGIFILLTYPQFVPMEEFSRSVYYVFMFITSLMTMGYIIKLAYFLKGTAKLDWNTKDALNHFIFEAKLTLEVYKSFIIAGSLLLPVPTFALLAGNKMSGDQLLFEKWFLLDISNFEITILVFAYMLVALIFYYITLSWTNLMYGKYLKVLQASVAELVD